jgi:hypothetical protein
MWMRGLREIMFHRIGEDEAAAMETRRAMAKSGDQNAPAQSAHGCQFRALRHFGTSDFQRSRCAGVPVE